ncbi:MAG TPA: hypothetical protein VII93_05535 [Anaerolineales bacterium]
MGQVLLIFGKPLTIASRSRAKSDIIIQCGMSSLLIPERMDDTNKKQT